jgi:ribosomal protein S24E
MENNILLSTKNPFLHREEILMEVTNSVCPTIEEVINLIGKEKEVVVVKKIQNNFGTNKFNVEILVYNDEESKKKVEVIPKKIRKKMEEEAKKVAEEERKRKAEEAKAVEEAKKAAEESNKTEENKEEVKDGD